jgi:hypothetical protein
MQIFRTHLCYSRHTFSETSGKLVRDTLQDICDTRSVLKLITALKLVH